ncbi:hypothetical protein [Rhizobium leguminosarum]|uniref:hypothetical protein n=1 Tax=Rhizobium leguminosarum TaxID=384 RepID=UPI002E153D24|nr:hypothetical protein U8Q02_40010 [Rhizobium leguminosarum]
MKTIAEANAYFESLEQWEDDTFSAVADPGDRHLELYNFKETIDLSPYAVEVTEDTSNEAYVADSDGWVEEDIVWSLKLDDFGWARLHLYCTPEVKDMGYWAELWLANEPWWNGHDPYECTDAQIAVLVSKLPDEHRAKYEELVSRSPEVTAHFHECGILKGEVAKP